MFVGLLVAQTVTGIVAGSVVDATGATVPGVAVQLRNDGTGDVRTGSVNESGDFVFSGVAPGAYTLTIEATGFKKVQKTNLNVTAAERLTAGRIVLEVGALTESITVSATGTAVQTMSQDRSAVVTSDQMNGLMTRGRDFLTMLRVLPGVTPNADPAAIGRTGFPNIQGTRMTYSTVSMDGSSLNDLGSMQALGAPTNMDAIAEIKVLLSNYQAEYGRTGGGVINAITKSGTTQYHGTAYYYKRHEEFNANTYFNNLNKVAKSRYRYNTWGGTIGGPIPLGKFKKDSAKLFFFYSQEYLPTASPGSLQKVTTPTDAEIGGDFSSTLDTGGKLVPINDPNTKVQFPGNKIPASLLNKNGQVLLGAFPRPNMTDRGITAGNYNYVFQETITSKQNNEVFRIDSNPTDKLRIYFRGAIYRQPQDGSAVAGGMAAWGMMPSEFKYSSDNGVLSANYTLSPTLVNEASIAGHHIIQRTSPLDDSYVQKLSRTALGYTLPQLYPGLNPLGLIPMASFGGVPSAAAFSTDARYPLKSADNVFDITDNVTKIFNKHILKAGVFIERVRYNGAAQGQNFGTFKFDRDINNPFDSNYAYSNALLGSFYSYQESNTRVAPTGRATTFEWFVQDNWKVTKKLTLDVGVRFSTYGPYAQKNGQAASFAPNSYSLANAPRLYYPALNSSGARVAYDSVSNSWAPALLIGAFVPNSGNTANGMVLDDGKTFSKGLMAHHTMLPAPRIGFAYDPWGNGKTAIRGGFGVVYNTRERVLLLDLIANPPVQYTPSIYYSTMSSLSQGGGFLSPSSGAGLDPNAKASSVMNMSLGVQRDIGFGTVVDVSYVSTMGRHLFQMHNLNTLPMGTRFQSWAADTSKSSGTLPDNYLVPFRGYSTTLNYEEYAGSSNYHSLQIQANRRFAHGMQFGANYTWAKSLDYASNDWGSVAQYTDRHVWNYGPSDFDKRHVVNVNWVWDLPQATKIVNNPIVKLVFNDWQFTGVATFATGTPVTPGFTTSDNADLTGGGDGIRMIMNGNPNMARGNRSFYNWFNEGIFSRPAKGTIGNMQRNALYKPGTNNFDLTFFKIIPLKERYKLQFRWEMYNAFNHTQFSGFNSTANFDAAGNLTNALSFGQLTSTNAARVMQGSIRFIF
jgi:outer membrane receptor protein involved in Fe transport